MIPTIPVLPLPAPQLFIDHDVAEPLADLESYLKQWLSRRVPEAIGELSAGELTAYCSGCPELAEIALTLQLVDKVKQSLAAQQMHGWKTVRDGFTRHQGRWPREPGAVVHAMYEDFGGLAAKQASGWLLLIPCPFGGWSLTNGTLFRRQASNPLFSLPVVA